MSEAGVILRAEAITKHYPGTVALDAVDFDVHRGKVNVLIGENGAGKSTLVKIFAGVEQPTFGCLVLEGEKIQLSSTRDGDRHSIGMIHQELNLCPNLTVAENIFLAREETRAGVIDARRQKAEACKLLDRLEQPIDPGAVTGELRLGEQQIVEIAKALARDVSILIMDEPTSALSNAEVQALFRVIEELKAQGVSIIYISHRLDELLRIGDQITVLRDGHLVASAPAEEVDLPWIVEKMVGGKLDSVFRSVPRESGAHLLEVRGMTVPKAGKGNAVDDVSLSVRSGEILGIYGLMGSGRTELLEALAGLRPDAAGVVNLGGVRLEGLDVAGRIDRGLVLVPEDRQSSGVVQSLSVTDNMILASLRAYTSGPLLDPAKVKHGTSELVQRLSIKISAPSQPITSLSGGNQQKVVVAKCLLTEPRVLLLDEPTRGIDVGAKGEICDIMNQLAGDGLGIIFASSELEEVLEMADRVLVLSRGKIAGEYLRAEATETKLAAAASQQEVSR